MEEQGRTEDVEADIRRLIDDSSNATPIAPENAEAYWQLDHVLRNKLLPKMKKGEEGDGPGPGGGASSTQARTLHWVLRFHTTDGHNYVNQLATMGAVILVPLPPDNKECLYFLDLKGPAERRIATKDDLKKLGGQIRFNDARPDSVQGVCEALQISEKP